MTYMMTAHGRYLFGGGGPLSPVQMDALASLFEQGAEAVDAPLGGRMSVKHADLPGMGRVVVKQYFRGGMVRHLVKELYFRWGKSRGQREFEMLAQARSLGISAPEPIAFACTAGLFYRAWLVMREIEGCRTLAEVSLEDAARGRGLMAAVKGQVSMLVDSMIRHVDLHPGNVLVDSDNRLFVIDFDRAYIYRGSRDGLRRVYEARWDRAVEKHGLPMCLALSGGN